MNYNIITDKNELIKFIDWLPDLQDNEKYYCSLLARKKYAEVKVRKSKNQLKRFVTDKERMFQKIKQLEIELGSYIINDNVIPQEAIVLYINPNPRNLKKATYDIILNLTKMLKCDNNNFNPHQEALSCIQQTIGRKPFVHFDIDDKSFDFNNLKLYINESCLNIFETRGGYHLLIEISKIEETYIRSFYKNIMDIGCIDAAGDQLLPVPGTIQGGFTPRFK